MKFRTVIEIICDEVDADNALHTAGEYLRGNGEPGVQMNFRTMSCNFHRIKNLFISGIIIVFVASVFVVGVGSMEGKIVEDESPAIDVTT